MKQEILYTVIIGLRSCTIKYATSPAYKVQAVAGTFADPGEASQQIKHSLQGKFEYLAEAAFDRKVSTLSLRYQQELARLADWNNGKKVQA